MKRYMRKLDSPEVYIETEALRLRLDMHPCTAEGELLNDSPVEIVEVPEEEEVVDKEPEKKKQEGKKK